jgi:hypothetical protein
MLEKSNFNIEKYKYLLLNFRIILGVIVISFIFCLAYGMYKQKYHPSKMYQFIWDVGINNQKQPKPTGFGNYEFDGYSTNVDRYRGYGIETFNKLGFNPLEDNEAYYNANTTGWQDFIRMWGQYGTLFRIPFSSNYDAIGNLFTGKVNLMDPDVEAAEEYDNAMKLCLSTRGGIWEIITNNFIYSAFPYGIFIFWLSLYFLISTIFLYLSTKKKLIYKYAGISLDFIGIILLLAFILIIFIALIEKN